MIKLIMGLILIAAICACNAEISPASDQPKDEFKKAASLEESNIITFKVNGAKVTTTGWTISRFSMPTDHNREWLNITSNMNAEKRTINVNLNGSEPGVYKMGDAGLVAGQSHGSFYPDYIGNLASSFSFKDGAFTLTSVDTSNRTVSGTFEGTVKNLKGDEFKITEGKIINGTLNLNVVGY